MERGRIERAGGARSVIVVMVGSVKVMAVLGRLDRDWQDGVGNGLSYRYAADAVER